MKENSLQLDNRVHAPGGSYSLGELISRVEAKMAGFSREAPVAMLGENPLDLIGAAGWLARTLTDGLLLSSERLSLGLQTRLRERGFSLMDLDRGIVTPPAERSERRPGRVSLMTSGTTGDPKVIEHTWDTLFTMDRVRTGKSANWLLTYQPGTYAWWQMVTLLLFLHEQALTLPRERTPVALMEAALQHGVTAVSATPTFWRMVFLQFPAEQLRQLPVRQLTLGGEAVDQPILDQLATTFPGVTLTHIYASSESGVAVVVRDGREGFPEGWLSSDENEADSAHTPRLQIREGILWIRSPYATQSGWQNSGDLCEVREGRIIILGREQSSFINVGGAKVPAHEVERVLRTHPAISWCRVGRRKAPFMGELVSADIVLKPASAPASDADLAGYCESRLAEHMVPRLWNFLETIPATDNLKTQLKS